MASGNYASFAINELGGPCKGCLTTPMGVEVQIYKTRLHVTDSQAWRPGAADEPVVMMIASGGSVTFRDLYVTSVSGPQGGIFFTAWYWNGDADAKWIAGCGVYGYEEEVYVGVTPESLQFLSTWLEKDGYTPKPLREGLKRQLAHLPASGKAPEPDPRGPRIVYSNENPKYRIVQVEEVLVLEEFYLDALGNPAWRQGETFRRGQSHSRIMCWLFDTATGYKKA